MKLHLKNDLGLRKKTIIKSYKADVCGLPEAEHTERGFDEVRDLLNKKTQWYTVEECKELVGSYMSSHDCCVCDNVGNGEFTKLQEYQAEKKYDTMKRAEDIIKNYS